MMDRKAPVYTLHVTVEEITPSILQWMVSLKDQDSRGARQLGYRASGTINKDLTGLQFTEEVEVHDGDREVWTEMPIHHRPDVRKKIIEKTKKACEMMVNSGESTFETKIP